MSLKSEDRLLRAEARASNTLNGPTNDGIVNPENAKREIEPEGLQIYRLVLLLNLPVHVGQERPLASLAPAAPA